MSRRLRLVSASGAKRGLRSAAIGALVSSNFQIVDLEDGECAIRFGNVLSDRNSFIEVVISGIDRTEIERRLGLYLQDNKTSGCISAGVALPWEFIDHRLGGDLPGKRESLDLTHLEQRAQAAAELLGIPIARIGESLLSEAAVMTEGDAMMLEWCKERLYERVAAKGKSDSALAAQCKRIAKAAAECCDTKSALRQVQALYGGESEPTPEVKRRMALSFNDELGKEEEIDFPTRCAIKKCNGEPFLEAVLSKVQAVLDAEAARKICKAKHGEVLEEAFSKLKKGESIKSTPPNCELCLQRAAELVDQHALRIGRLEKQVTKKQRSVSHNTEVQRDMQKFLTSMRERRNAPE